MFGNMTQIDQIQEVKGQYMVLQESMKKRFTVTISLIIRAMICIINFQGVLCQNENSVIDLSKLPNISYCQGAQIISDLDELLVDSYGNQYN